MYDWQQYLQNWNILRILEQCTEKLQVSNLEAISNNLDKALRLLEEDLEQQEEELERNQKILENIDNNLRKQQQQIKGLMKGVEGRNLRYM